MGQDAASGALLVVYAATAQVEPAGYYGPGGGLKGPPVQARVGKPGLDDESGERRTFALSRIQEARSAG